MNAGLAWPRRSLTTFLAALDGDGELLPLRASCRPKRGAVETGFFYELTEGQSLDVRRDRDSRLNRNAVFLASGSQRLGYLQADAARALGPELDAGLEAVAVIVEIRMPAGGTSEVIVDVRAL